MSLDRELQGLPAWRGEEEALLIGRRIQQRGEQVREKTGKVFFKARDNGRTPMQVSIVCFTRLQVQAKLTFAFDLSGAMNLTPVSALPNRGCVFLMITRCGMSHYRQRIRIPCYRSGKICLLSESERRIFWYDFPLSARAF